ncbi:MAG: hypothetical protein SAMD01599839_21870 [Rectinema sp.]
MDKSDKLIERDTATVPPLFRLALDEITQESNPRFIIVEASSAHGLKSSARAAWMRPPHLPR